MNHIGKKIITLLLLCCFALASLTGCGGNQNAGSNDSASSEPIRIGCKSMPEQMILQEILAQLIEAKTDYTVE